MSSDRDVTRIVRSWLDEGVTALPDRVLDSVLDQIPATPQRRSAWPAWRTPTMNKIAGYGLAAAAVVIAAFIAYQVLGGRNVGGPLPVATPSSSLMPSPSPQAWVGPIQVGRNEAMIGGVRFSFSVPEGWSRTQFEGMIRAASPPYKWVGFLNTFDSVASDPCTGATTAAGPSVTGLAEALTTIPGTEAEAPTDATVGGLPAKLVTLTIDDDIGCAPSSFWIYGPNSAYPNGVDSTIKIWVFELDGTRYSIHSDQVDSDADGAREIADIVDSIQFE